MPARLLDRRAATAAVKADLRERVAPLAAAGLRPGLGTVLVGDDPGSRVYVAGKHRDGEEVGIASLHEDLPAEDADGLHPTDLGRFLGLLLTRRGVDATVTLTHTATEDLAGHVRRADVVVAAAGSAHLVTADMVRPGAAVLDVGVTRVLDEESGRSRLLGDVHPGVAEVAGHLSPDPGGVGPMTRALLLTNVVEAAERALAARS